MMNLKNMSIKNKLIGIILVVVLLVIGIGFTTVTTIHIGTLRQELVNNVLMNARLVSEHCVVPLTFDDNKAVTKALQPLNLIPFVENGCVYDTSGRLLASYNRSEGALKAPILDEGSRWYFESDFLHVVQPISHNDKKLGMMHLRASTEYLSRRTNVFFMTMLGICLGLILVSYFIALWLQGIISKPILGLAAVTRDISRQGDYSVRVSIQRSDEIGELYSGFNNMLDQINRRESERKAAEQELLASEKKFRTYISSAPDAIFIIDSEGCFIEVNRAACELTGYSDSELTKMTISDTLDTESYAVILENFEILKKTGRIRSEFKLKRKCGTIIWAFLDAVSLTEDKYMAFCSDISETKRLQEQETRAQRLETAGTIAGQVAHDFNNLLAPLMAYPDFIREDLPENHPALSYLDDIENSANKIAEINQQLLTLGRRGHYNQEALNLNTIIHQIVKEMGSLADNVTIESNLAPDLMNILGGGSQIHRMITNIMFNAVDAMQDTGKINITTENFYVDDEFGAYSRVPRGEFVKLTIADTGRGIPDDILQKILDPFFTTKTSDKRRGSGLGLSVVDAVVKDHNGFMDLETKPGKGTSFYFYFPITRKSTDSHELVQAKGGSETILVVDDDDIQRKVSSLILTKLGYEVSSVESGEKAIEFLKRKPQDLVILDMVMPGGIDGAETYRQIIENRPHQKAIILSGFSESDRVLEAQKLGAGVFVKKPVTKHLLAAAVRAELDNQLKAVTAKK